MLGQVLYTTGFIYHSVILWMKHCHDYHGSSISALLRVIDLLLSHLPHHHQILCIMMVPTTASQNHPPSTTKFMSTKHEYMQTLNMHRWHKTPDNHNTGLNIAKTKWWKRNDFLSVFQIITDAILSYCRLYISKNKHSEMSTNFGSAQHVEFMA